jgi:pyruvyltransferase
MKIYHSKCAGNKNFGDILGPYIVEKLSQKNVIFSEVEQSEAVIIGSILEHLPQHYKGIVAGIGVARSSTRKDLSKAKVLALRGEHTLNAVNTNQSNILLADPGLLAPYVVDVSNVKKQHKTGVILHYADKQFKKTDEDYVIDILSGIENVITEAAKCEKIITSSLHGLILADSLNIERKWVLYDRVQGGGYKFKDYASSIKETLTPDVWCKADFNLVEEKQEKLLELFKCL